MADKKNPWKRISKRVVYKWKMGSFIEEKVLNPIGKKITYSWLSVVPGVAVVALNNKNEILLIREYRLPAGGWVLELPGGAKESLAPLAAAKKEFLEETGYTAKKWSTLGKVISLPGMSDANSFLFLAQDLVKVDHGRDMHKEGIDGYEFLPFKKALHMVAAGKINHTLTITGILKAGTKLGLLE